MAHRPLNHFNELGYSTGEINQYLASLLAKMSLHFLRKYGYTSSKKDSIETCFVLRKDSNKPDRYRLLALLKIALGRFIRFAVSEYLKHITGADRILREVCNRESVKIADMRVDSYLTSSQQAEVIPWHRDGSPKKRLLDEKSEKGYYTLKLFVFLNPRGGISSMKPGHSGSLQLAPGSHKIVRLLDTFYHRGRIGNTRSNWSYEDIVDNANEALTCKNLSADSRKVLLEFTKGVNLDKGRMTPSNVFVAAGRPGNFVLFDEKTLHKGCSQPGSPRLVLRVLWMCKR